MGVILAAKGTPLQFGRQREIFPATLWTLREFLVGILISAGFAGLVMVSSLGGGWRQWKTSFSICGLAYLPLAAAGLFIVYFRGFVAGGAELVPLVLAATGLERWLDAERLTPDLGTLRLLVYPVIIAGALLSWVVLGHLQRENARCSGLFCHRLLVILAAAAFIVLL